MIAGSRSSSPTWLLRLFQIFSAKLVLEVFGGAGAIWGFSEVLTLRNPETQELWRKNALIVGTIFLVRYAMQIRDYVEEQIHGQSLEKPNSWKRMFQIFSAKIVLEVFGAGGAIWGFSEVLTLRNPETQEFWRLIALIVAVVFMARFLMQCFDYCLEIQDSSETGDEEQRFISEIATTIRKETRTWQRFFQVFSAKIVLEVFGAGGAIWGFSEVLTLRYLKTQELWRTNALIIAVIFSIRYMLQSKDFIAEMDGIDKERQSTDETEDLTFTETSPLSVSSTYSQFSF